MSNWNTLTEDGLDEVFNPALLAKVRAVAAAKGQPDPLPGIFSDIISQIRARISVGNALDVNPANIPNSLLGLGYRITVRRLKGYLQMALTEDERQDAKDDLSYQNRITDDKIRFETPDNPAGNAEMQAASGEVDVIHSSRTYASREKMNGLL